MKLIYTNADGSVSIVHSASKSNLEQVLGPLTDEKFRKHVIERSIPPEANNVIEMPDDWEPPTDRYFRNAWVQSDAAVVVDMPRAREVQKKVLRTLRKPLLEALDVEMIIALESANSSKIAEIKTRKQGLRDITDDPTIEAAQTPEQLKRAGLSILSLKSNK